ncbi:MAG: M20/M25/M40 family metallo-hydrolase [Aerococcus sp.]|nr:M20/M25/M40 family metallo-hydrolase [Aerococcus sp.]
MERAERIRELLLRFVAIKTDTGTELERNNRLFYEKWFKEVDYFKEHPECSGFYPIKADPLGREVCWALLLGKSKETVILIHHTDVVDTEDYGRFKEAAYDPELLEDILKRGALALPRDAVLDLNSDEWLFGRGVSDMKSGGAMQCALFEEYAVDPTFAGSVLIIGVPDEENMSAGMRGALPLLTELKQRYHLNYRLLINSEPHERQEPNEVIVHDGSVGKLMPIVLVRGKLSHVSEVYQGLNATQLLAAIVRQTEIDPWFVENKHDTVIPAATWLAARDLKQAYDVSLPLFAGGYLSVLHANHTPNEIMHHLFRDIKTAIHQAMADLKARYNVYATVADNPMPFVDSEPLVLSYQELYQRVLNENPTAKTTIQAKEKQLTNDVLAGTLAFDQANFQLMMAVLELWSNKSPVVVTGLMAPYYPAVSNADKSEWQWVSLALEALKQEVALPNAQTMKIEHYFTGISDLSYAMYTAPADVIEKIERNLLFWGSAYDIPFQDIQNLNVPVVNMGAWGKDLHRYTERVNKADLFKWAPERLDHLIRLSVDDALIRNES